MDGGDGFAVKSDCCWAVGKRQQLICCGKSFEGHILHGVAEPTFSASAKKRAEKLFFHQILKLDFFFSELSSVGSFRSCELN